LRANDTSLESQCVVLTSAPKGASRTQPVSAIVTVTGSGPQDRDENIGLRAFRPFRQIADALGRRAIAVLRMDHHSALSRPCCTRRIKARVERAHVQRERARRDLLEPGADG
jgi:hypothetical protein